jgi:hypothetical protein
MLSDNLFSGNNMMLFVYILSVDSMVSAENTMLAENILSDSMLSADKIMLANNILFI